MYECVQYCLQEKQAYKWAMYIHSLITLLHFNTTHRHPSTSSKNTATTTETQSHKSEKYPPSYNYKPTFDYVPWQDWFPHVISWMGWHFGLSFVLSIFVILVCRCILLSRTFGRWCVLDVFLFCVRVRDDPTYTLHHSYLYLLSPSSPATNYLDTYQCS